MHRKGVACIGWKAGTLSFTLCGPFEINGWVYNFVEGGTSQDMVNLLTQAPLHVLGGVAVRW
ncbi:MAG: hypothetical protein KF905_01810 [Flavobacteriales bacterium]|nr:hypothetical protein [Flavobacteriales bacterium]